MNRKHWVCNIGKLLGKLLSITDFFFDHLIWLHDVSIVAGETVSVVQDLSRSTKTLQPRCPGLAVAGLGPTCSTECGSSVPPLGIKHTPLALQSGFLTTRPPGKANV